MARSSVDGEATDALDITDIDCERFSETIKGIGAKSALTGTCGGRTTTTDVRAGFGPTITKKSDDISTACACTGAGTVRDGTRFAATGICGVAIATTTTSMDERDGRGVVTAASGSICIAIATCGEITKATGAVCDPIGISGDEIITTDVRDGAGADTGEFIDICIACESCDGGLAVAGQLSASTGTSFEGTITTTGCMGEPVGSGEDTGELVCTCTATVPSGEITRDIGVESDLIGICGGRIITTALAGGSGEPIVGLDDICTDCEFSAAGMAHVGEMCAATGISTVATITTIRTMVATAGPGAGSVALAHTCTACERSIVITRDIGGVSVPTGICTAGMPTTSELVGSGVGTEELVITCIASES